MLVMLCALALSACSTLTAFNRLTPKDQAQRMARDAPFGPGPRQKLDVYVPPPGVERGPVVVFFYGGSWASGRRQDYAFAARALAARGFVTVLPDYRLYPEVRYPDFMNDAAMAVRWTRDNIARFGGDPARITLAGHSAGGYIAVQLALNTRFLTEVGVDPGIVRAAAGISGPYDFLPLEVASTINTFGRFADLPATQPVNHARADAPPLFLAWGDADELVGPQNHVNLEAALRRAGAEVEVKVYPRADHVDMVLSLSRPFRRRSGVLEDMTRFLKARAIP